MAEAKHEQPMGRVCRQEGLYKALCGCWLLTVFFSHFGGGIVIATLPGIGDIFPFRLLLPITALLYLIWMLKGNDHPWKESSKLDKWVYGLIISMMVYSILSLPRAMEFSFTFRRLFFDQANQGQKREKNSHYAGVIKRLTEEHKGCQNGQK